MDLSEYRGLCPSCLKKVGEEKEICPHCQNLLNSENQPHQLAVGSALGGKYYIGRALGESRQSITYIGLDLTKNQRVIIKEFFPRENALRQADRYTVVPDANTSGADMFNTKKAYFMERINNLAFFRRYKGVVALIEKFEENGTVYKIMEYEEGMSLSRIYEKTGSAFPANELLLLLEPVFMAVNAFNEERIVHGGICPDNIIVTNDGARLLDFADEVFRGENETQNLSYLAPEQINSIDSIGPWTDTYSLASVYYRGITGFAPLSAKKRIAWFKLETPTVLNQQININIEKAVLKALSVDPKHRYKKASQFYDDLVSAIINQR